MTKPIAELFPHHSQSALMHRCYMMNIIKMTEYAPVTMNDVVMVLANHIRKLDAEMEIPDEDDEEETQQQDDEPPALFDFELEMLSQQGPESNMSIVEKLDMAMDMAFTFIKGLESNLPLLNVVFKALLQHFSASVISTKALYSTQFLMFFICSMNNNYSLTFMEFLLKKIFDDKIHTDTRIDCISYLASFMARANFISVSAITRVLEALINSMTNYVKAYEPKMGNVDTTAHRLFYMNCECVFYSLCFKTEYILKENEGKKFFAKYTEHLVRIVSSKFYPFKVCCHIICFLRLF